VEPTGHCVGNRRMRCIAVSIKSISKVTYFKTWCVEHDKLTYDYKYRSGTRTTIVVYDNILLIGTREKNERENTPLDSNLYEGILHLQLIVFLVTIRLCPSPR
jgi:hypothetical protein